MDCMSGRLRDIKLTVEQTCNTNYDRLLTEIGGTVQFKDLQEGLTLHEEVDEVTGLSRKVIIEHSGQTLRPRVSIKDESGKTAKA